MSGSPVRSAYWATRIAPLMAALFLLACGGETETPARDEASTPVSGPVSGPVADPGDATDHAKDMDVCALILPADLEPRFGHAFISGGRTELADVYPAWGCAHSSAEGAHPAGAAAFMAVSVQLSTWPGAPDLEAYLASISDHGMFTVMDVNGVGPVAYWNGLATTQYGRHKLSVRVSGDHGLDDEALQAMTLDLIALARSRL